MDPRFTNRHGREIAGATLEDVVLA